MNLTQPEIEAMAHVRGYVLCKTFNRWTPYKIACEWTSAAPIVPFFSLREAANWLARKAAIRPYPKSA